MTEENVAFSDDVDVDTAGRFEPSYGVAEPVPTEEPEAIVSDEFVEPAETVTEESVAFSDDVDVDTAGRFEPSYGVVESVPTEEPEEIVSDEFVEPVGDVTEKPDASVVISSSDNSTKVSSEVSGGEAAYVKWFSGASDSQYFEVSRQTEPYVIEGNDVCQAIHVNCGYDTYGWIVTFDNGTVMSLSDVREYQLRNGNLPDENGVIRYGENEFVFRQINRIVLYKSVQYFSYGV